MKCSICNQNIQTTFLNKLVGTTIRKDGKLKGICASCQKEHSAQDLNSLI